jgi:hypothetical protein
LSKDIQILCMNNPAIFVQKKRKTRKQNWATWNHQSQKYHPKATFPPQLRRCYSQCLAAARFLTENQVQRKNVLQIWFYITALKTQNIWWDISEKNVTFFTLHKWKILFSSLWVESKNRYGLDGQFLSIGDKEGILFFISSKYFCTCVGFDRKY